MAELFKDPWFRALFASLIGITALIIVLLIYLLKSKFVPKTVSSTFIWKRSIKKSRRMPINFVMSLLLVTQILVVIAAALSLADIYTKPFESKATILIVDASASMKATNNSRDGKSRYDVALADIRARAEKVNENSAMSIIVAGEYPEFLTKTVEEDKETGEEEELHYVYTRDEAVAVVDKLLPGKCTNIETDINEAIALAQKALDQNGEATVYLYTDRIYAAKPTTDQKGAVTINVINCADSETDWNAGITTFDDELLAAGYEYSANIINKGSDAEFIVSLTVDGASVATKKINMSKGETRKIVFSPKATENSEAIKIKSIKKYEKAKIEINTKTDIISDDNVAYLTAVPQADLRVIYVSNNLKLTSAGAIDYTYQTRLQLSLGASGLVINSTDIYHSSQVKSAPITGYDLYIYEGVMPVSMPEDGAVWFLNAPSSPVGTNIVFSEEKKDASVDGSGGYGFVLNDTIGPIGSQIKNNVDFSQPVELVLNGELIKVSAVVEKMTVIGNVNEQTGEIDIRIPDGFETVYNCTYNIALKDAAGNMLKNENGVPVMAEVKTPAFLVGKVNTSRIIVTTFDFTNTSLPIFIADYPILLKNMIDYSMPDILPDRTPTIGDDLKFNAPAGVESITYYYKSYQTQMDEDSSGNATLGTEINKWSSEESAEPPLVNLNELGIYNVVVKYKPQITIDEDGGIIENVAETDTFAVSTYMPLSEIDINAIGPTLESLARNDEVKDIRGRSILWVFVLLFIILIIVEWGVYYRDEY